MECANLLCTDCGKTRAEVFCTCTDPETFLCLQCLPKHSLKRSRTGHSARSISEFSSYKNPVYFDLQTVQHRARQEVAAIDTAIQQFSAMVGTVIQNIQVSAEATIARLKDVQTQLSAEVEAALEEVEITLSESQPRLKTKYAATFRALVDSQVTDFSLFVFTPPTSTESTLSIDFGLVLPTDVWATVQGKTHFVPQLPKGLFEGTTENPEAAEAYYCEAIQTCAAHYPGSAELAKCHYNLGRLYVDLSKWEQAKQYLLQASKLFDANFPEDYDYPNCLQILGSLAFSMDEDGNAIDYYDRANKVYERYSSESLGYANCLANLGRLHLKKKQYGLGEPPMLQACSIYEAKFPKHLNFAHNSYYLGLLYRDIGKKQEAAEKLKTALGIYEKNGDLNGANLCKRDLEGLGSCIIA